MCMCVRVYIHECSAAGRQKRVLDPTKLDSKVVVSLPMWVLENQLGPSARAIFSVPVSTLEF